MGSSLTQLVFVNYSWLNTKKECSSSEMIAGGGVQHWQYLHAHLHILSSPLWATSAHIFCNHSMERCCKPLYCAPMSTRHYFLLAQTLSETPLHCIIQYHTVTMVTRRRKQQRSARVRKKKRISILHLPVSIWPVKYLRCVLTYCAKIITWW